ncbi:MAG TPA: putative toxin-antitoxin system toxin component, PIN family [Acidobacteriaceae bacterium]|nr:putative toxin-antitoxin system toxin component, PIN family [Acidobacteriaceae bacterium]
MNRRVVLDTSVLVSAGLRPGSNPYLALVKALATCDVCASVETLAELARVLSRKKFDLYLEHSARMEFIELVNHHSHLFAVDEAACMRQEPGCRDPKDNIFLALAETAEADVLVSSDEDLLILHPWREIAILTPLEFLTRPLGG